MHLLRKAVLTQVRPEDPHSHPHRIQAVKVQVLPSAVRRSQQPQQTYSPAPAESIAQFNGSAFELLQVPFVFQDHDQEAGPAEAY